MNYRLPCNHVLMDALVQFNSKLYNMKEQVINKSGSMFVEISFSKEKIKSHEIELGNSILISNQWFISYIGIDSENHHFEIHEWVKRFSQTRVHFIECKNNTIIQLGKKLLLVVSSTNSIILFELN